jgi:hypothetical protein
VDTRRKYEHRRLPQGLFVCNRECVGHVPDLNPVAVDQNTDDVKPILLCGLPMAINPDPSRSIQLALLSPINSLDRPPEVVALSGLYLDEGYGHLPPDDQVDIPSSILESTVHNDPAITAKPPFRDPLSKLSKRLRGR